MLAESRILSIVGGSLALFLAILIIVFLVAIDYSTNLDPDYDGNNTENERYGSTISIPAIFGICAALVISGTLGIIGGILVKKKSKLSGILMLIGAVGSAIFIIPSILLLLSGIFALVKERSNAIGA